MIDDIEISTAINLNVVLVAEQERVILHTKKR